MNTASELKLLVKKYDDSIREREEQIIEIKRKRAIAMQALELLSQEGIKIAEIAEPAVKAKDEIRASAADLELVESVPAPAAIKAEVKAVPPGVAKPGAEVSHTASSGMGEALRLIFKAHKGEYISAAEVYDELMKGGFSSGSADIKRDVHIRLYRWNKSNIISSTEEGGVKKYQIMERK